MHKLERGDLVFVEGGEESFAQIIWRNQGSSPDERPEVVYVRTGEKILCTVSSVYCSIVDIIVDGRIGWTVDQWVKLVEQQEEQ